jgi:heparosan-N-sulfate-glucuronate 5-epimerase
MPRLRSNPLQTAVMGYNELAGRGPWFTHQALGRHIDPEGVAGYYCDLGFKADWASRWGDGFPMLGPDGPRAESAIPVSQAALGYWERHLEGADTLEPFTRLADWLVDTADPTPVGPVWRTPVAVSKYELEAGWISALGQGQALSVLVRAHALTGAARYLDLARAALEPFERDVAAGGLARTIDGHVVLEEYPTVKPCAVLNGWIYALFGIHELANHTGDERPRQIADSGAAAVVALLPRFDTGSWSLYSLYDHGGGPDLAKPFYQRLHPVLLRGLDLIGPDPALEATAARWEAQVTPARIGRIVANKILFRAGRQRDARARARA